MHRAQIDGWVAEWDGLNIYAQVYPASPPADDADSLDPWQWTRDSDVAVDVINLRDYVTGGWLIPYTEEALAERLEQWCATSTPDVLDVVRALHTRQTKGGDR